MICLITALTILGTPPELKCNSKPQVSITVGESESQKKEREERNRVIAEAKERGESYTGGSATKLYRDSTNNCVQWAKNQTGIHRTLGNGARLGIQGQEPRIGAIGAMAGRTPHAVLIVAINGDNLLVNESNHYKGWITQRTVKKSQMLGYIYN